MIISKEHFKKQFIDNTIKVTILPIMLDNNCNAQCKACIGKHIFKSDLCKDTCTAYSTCNKLRCCDHIADDDTFYNNLRFILSTITSDTVHIILTGGEPTLSSRLLPMIELLKEYSYTNKIISIETNGAKLGDSAIEAAIKENNIQIYLSRYSGNEQANLEEFNFKEFPVTNEMVKDFANRYGNLLYTNTIILKKNICDIKSLLKCITDFEELGVKQHGFVEFLADPSLSEQNKELIKYYNDQKVNVSNLIKELPYTRGVQEISSYQNDYAGSGTYLYGTIPFTISFAKLEKQYRRKVMEPIRKFLIVPSGEISIDRIEQ